MNAGLGYLEKTMSWIRYVAREIAGLFVDDGSLALAVLGWAGLLWVFRHRLAGFALGGVLLFSGLAVILVESLIRFARHRDD